MATPEMEKEFLEAAKKEWKKVQVRKEKLERGKSRLQRDIGEIKRKAAELRQKYMVEPSLRDIEQKFMEKVKAEGATQLVCPACGEPDRGNKMNGKPWCFKCNVVLVPKGKVSKWFKGTVKVLKKSLKDELKRLNPGLEPNNEEMKDE